MEGARMNDQPTAAPFIWPYRDHRNMAEVARDEYAASFHKPFVEPVHPEPLAMNPPEPPVPGKIWCRHCDVHWFPPAVRACPRTSCPAKKCLP